MQLNNQDLRTIVEGTATTSQNAQTAYYELYKSTYSLMQSLNFRGNAADKYKSYLGQVTVEAISGLLNLTQEVATLAKSLEKSYLSIESSETGILNDVTLTEVKKILNQRLNDFDSSMAVVNSISNQARQYVTVPPYKDYNVFNSFAKTNQFVGNTASLLAETDAKLSVSTKEFLEKVKKMNTLLKTIHSTCFNKRAIDYSAISKISGNLCPGKAYMLVQMMVEDPFANSANRVSVGEGQWVPYAFANDAYLVAQYQALYAEYQYVHQDGTYSISGNAGVFNAGGQMQFTDYLRAQADISVLTASGAAMAGWSAKYIGFQASGEVTGAKAKASAVIGKEIFGGYAKADASVLTASGDATFYIKSAGNWSIGLDGQASLAEAKAGVGMSFFNYQSVQRDNQGNIIQGTEVKKGLLSASAQGKATAGVGAGIVFSSETAYDLGIVNIDAFSVHANGKLGLGADVSVTVPSISIDWPWG